MFLILNFQLSCGGIILYHMRIQNSDVETLVILCICLGVCYGMQNVLLAVAPGEVYGSSHLTIIFGYVLFFCGIGAILGPPLASESLFFIVFFFFLQL
jgi:hypothetical protein